jgi:hypothetical protein
VAMRDRAGYPSDGHWADLLVEWFRCFYWHATTFFSLRCRFCNLRRPFPDRCNSRIRRFFSWRCGFVPLNPNMVIPLSKVV